MYSIATTEHWLWVTAAWRPIFISSVLITMHTFARFTPLFSSPSFSGPSFSSPANSSHPPLGNVNVVWWCCKGWSETCARQLTIVQCLMEDCVLMTVAVDVLTVTSHHLTTSVHLVRQLCRKFATSQMYHSSSLWCIISTKWVNELVVCLKVLIIYFLFQLLFDVILRL